MTLPMSKGQLVVKLRDAEAENARLRERVAELEQLKARAEPQIVTHGDDLLTIAQLRQALADRDDKAKQNCEHCIFGVAVRQPLDEAVTIQLTRKVRDAAVRVISGLPLDLLNDALEFGITNDGLATLTWYKPNSIAAISIDAQSMLYFSTVSKNGQRLRGCKPIAKLDLVVEAIRDA